MTTQFTESDADGNGRLNEAESEVFFKKIGAADEERGVFGGMHEGGYSEYYHAFNAITPGEEGYTLGEFFEGWGPIMKIWEELKAGA